MKYLPLIAALAATPAMAQDTIAQDKVLVLACLETMEAGTTWPQCVELMFQPCVSHEVGTDAHATCLGGVREEWSGTVKTLQDEVIDAVTTSGSSQLLDLLGQWTSYVVQKCQEVAASKQEGAESARLGCEISEFAGLSGEFAACLEGRSKAGYCEFRE
ncbi:hypothetical protein BCF46_0534 [Litoreibacter meonggei]|uniref:Lysozyme inhibitor LprI N-terminal domain-containing protein n=1 Tax=Litoreibacter meonggei TaxID=1049199 RepID=A0A497X504_9RHOB|nr:hypothetical protein [Litoreibacter meonggei]RLJ60336.1 hypothetical protein BCF46_0534 [Litoreibacter meonggei]